MQIPATGGIFDGTQQIDVAMLLVSIAYIDRDAQIEVPFARREGFQKRDMCVVHTQHQPPRQLLVKAAANVEVAQIRPLEDMEGTPQQRIQAQVSQIDTYDVLEVVVVDGAFSFCIGRSFSTFGGVQRTPRERFLQRLPTFDRFDSFRVLAVLLVDSFARTPISKALYIVGSPLFCGH